VKLVETYFCDAMKSTPSIINGCVLYCSFWNGELQFALTLNASLIAKEHGQRLVDLFVSNLNLLALENQ
jgi:hypothetical protein